MAGLAATRARGRNGGRPTVWTTAKVEVVRSMYPGGEHGVATIARVVGVSRASVYRVLTQGESNVLNGYELTT
jgi:DNA invertase Pin-like site-specific DNA recombinase